MLGTGISVNGERVLLSPEPQETEAIDGSADRGIILVDNLGKRSVFMPKGTSRRDRARHRSKRPIRSWVSRFCSEARGQISAHTYLRVNGTVTIYPASEDLRRMLLSD